MMRKKQITSPHKYRKDVEKCDQHDNGTSLVTSTPVSVMLNKKHQGCMPLQTFSFFYFVTAVASAFAAPTLLAVTVMESCDIYGVL